MKIESFKDLRVWQLAHELVLETYQISKSFPKTEIYGITSQLLRAVVSVPTNIAEGKGRFTKKEYIRFLIIARGSLEECKYLFYLCKDLNFISLEIYQSFELKFNQVGKMLNSLINSLKTPKSNT